MKKIVLLIEGMTCSACSNGLEKYLNKQEGVNSASVNLIMSNASIEYDEKKLDLNDLDRFVKEAGFKSLGKYKLNFEEKKSKIDQYKIIAIGVFSVVVMFFSMAHMFNLKIDQNISSIIGFIFATLILFLGTDIIKNGFKNLIHKSPNMDTLVSLGVLASYIYSTFGMFQQIINNKELTLFFESSVMVMFFVKLGKFIERKNIYKTKEAIQKLVTITPKDATIIKNDEEVVVTIDEIKKGDIVLCRPGQKIAVDGEIISRRNSY